MHLADTFIQSDLKCIPAIILFVSMCSLGIEPTTFALLTQRSTTEPQEQYVLFVFLSGMAGVFFYNNISNQIV